MSTSSRRESWLPRRTSTSPSTTSSTPCPTYRLDARVLVYSILTKYSGHQGPDLPQVPRLCQGAVRLETLLLEPHQRGHPVPEGLPPPAPRDRPRHPQETGSQGDQAQSRRCPQIRRHRQGGRQRGLQEGWRGRQGRSCWPWLRPHGVQRRIRSWQAPAVKFFGSVIYMSP